VHARWPLAMNQDFLCPTNIIDHALPAIATQYRRHCRTLS
jgi:hypothetical protein